MTLRAVIGEVFGNVQVACARFAIVTFEHGHGGGVYAPDVFPAIDSFDPERPVTLADAS
ncbi:hypothetical protein [Paraburkholderia haematera]|uniref:hypothetical protein n=1 Tax=Paraburkholderia haematera TaxID=2793077 RepID=UPI001B8D9DD9|nr:hypothetical protein [Paraburkholderia haematera]